MQRLEINGGALGEEKGRKKRKQHELKQRGLRSHTQNIAQKPFCVTDLC